MSIGLGIAILGVWLPVAAAYLSPTITASGLRQAQLLAWLISASLLFFYGTSP